MKEQYEWIHSWVDEAPNSGLPRVVLIGDSITHGYQTLVREKLKGKCYVDYIATSYAIDTNIYNILVETFISDSHYDLIHFNHGLHGKHMTLEVYKTKLESLLKKIGKGAVVLATTTAVREKDSDILEKSWMEKVLERNEAVKDIAISSYYGIDNLYEISLSMPIFRKK